MPRCQAGPWQAPPRRGAMRPRAAHRGLGWKWLAQAPSDAGSRCIHDQAAGRVPCGHVPGRSHSMRARDRSDRRAWRMAPPSRCGCALCRQRAGYPGACLLRAIARRAVTGWRPPSRTTRNPPGMATGGPSRPSARQALARLLRLRSSLAGLRASTPQARSVHGGLRSPRNSPPCARQPVARTAAPPLSPDPACERREPSGSVLFPPRERHAVCRRRIVRRMRCQAIPADVVVGHLVARGQRHVGVTHRDGVDVRGPRPL